MSTLVLAHGTFDLLHIGHVMFLKRARELGDFLVVTLTADAFVNKGPGRPIYNEQERAEMIRSLKCVSAVEIVRHKTGLPAIEKHKPEVYAKGSDYRETDKHGALIFERTAVERHGGRLVIIETPRWSSSELIERVAKWKELQCPA